MNAPLADPGSLRDPANRVYVEQDRVLRAVMAPGADAYRAAREAGLYETLADSGLLLPARELLAEEIDPLPGAVHTLEHPVIPFVSYPYEWSFALHRAAALLHLDLHLAALDAGFTLTDATAYNVQFRGTEPVFIDHLSLRPYRDGGIWAGHRQFCMQFLNPLLLWSHRGVQPNHWFRGALEGIEPEAIAALLPLRSKLSWTVMTHVSAQAALGRRSLKTRRGEGRPTHSPHLPKAALIGMLGGLKRYIARLRPPHGQTVWADYAGATSYTEDETAAKRAFVHEMAAATKPRLLVDLGCNTGDYSEIALDAGAEHVVGFDFDHATLDRAYDRFKGSGRSFLPLWMDAANPSPAQGWAQAERKGLRERASADALIALAIIHHIAIGRNVPLDMAVDWIVGLAPTGIVEFPSKDDPMVRTLLANREDIFPGYTEEAFLASMNARAGIVRQRRVSDNGRLLVWYDRTRSRRVA